MKTYHIVITEYIVGEVNIFISDKEPDAHSGALKTGDSDNEYYIYGTTNLYPLLCIDIGREIERKESKVNEDKE